MYFFHLVHISRTQKVFLIFENYLKIIKWLYLNHEPVEFDNILNANVKFKKITLLKKFFRLNMGFFFSSK